MLNMACVLSVFDIVKARDATGREIEPKVEFTTGITRYSQCQRVGSFDLSELTQLQPRKAFYLSNPTSVDF